jgi:glycosyltransferase involved in cell wall biosynthesis
MISFAVTTKNEGHYIRELLNQLVPFCIESGDEIVVVDDYSTDEETVQILAAHESAGNISLHQHALNKDFAAHKNYLAEQCRGDYIFQIDADEILHDHLLQSIGNLLELNPTVDLIYVPRVNIVDGMEDEDVARYGWRVNLRKWIQWPDYQSRIYRRSPTISWQGKVHERIVGFEISATLPAEEEWAIYHIKDIERQRRQNAFYDTI